MAGGVKETNPEKLAHYCDSMREGAKKLFESGPNKGDMWFFELYHHLGDCAELLRKYTGQRDIGRMIGWDAAKRDTSKNLGTDQ